MFQPITIVHLCFLAIFAFLGLKGLFVYRDKAVGMHLIFRGQRIMRINHSDVVLLFAVLSFMTLGESNFEFLNWARAQLDVGPGSAYRSALILAAYLTTLICVMGYGVISTIVIVVGMIAGAFQKRRTGNSR